MSQLLLKLIWTESSQNKATGTRPDQTDLDWTRPHQSTTVTLAYFCIYVEFDCYISMLSEYGHHVLTTTASELHGKTRRTVQAFLESATGVGWDQTILRTGLFLCLCGILLCYISIEASRTHHGSVFNHVKCVWWNWFSRLGFCKTRSSPKKATGIGLDQTGQEWTESWLSLFVSLWNLTFIFPH